jgi:hypothetical protein
MTQEFILALAAQLKLGSLCDLKTEVAPDGRAIVRNTQTGQTWAVTGEPGPKPRGRFY